MPCRKRLRGRRSSVEGGSRIDTWCTSVSPRCPIKAECSTGNERCVRWPQHEAVLEATQAKVDRGPDATEVRRRTVEHVFGTLKRWIGSPHFLMKTLVHVPTEISLHALAYNLERIIAVLGNAKAMKAMRLAGA
jgi:hypothetical protein